MDCPLPKSVQNYAKNTMKRENRICFWREEKNDYS